MSERYRDENGLAHDIGSNYSPIKNETNNVSTSNGRYRDENGLAHDINNSVPNKSYYTDTLPGAPNTGGTDSNKLPLDFVSQQPTVQPYWEPDKIVERYDWYRANPDKEPEIVGPTKQETESAYTYLANTKFKNVPRNDWEMTDYDTDPYYQSVISNWKDPREPQTKEAAATLSDINQYSQPKEMQGSFQDLNLARKADVMAIPTGAVTEGAPAISRYSQAIIPALGQASVGKVGGELLKFGITKVLPKAAGWVGWIPTVFSLGTASVAAYTSITGKEAPQWLQKTGRWLDIVGTSTEKALVGLPATIKSLYPETDSNTDWGYKNPNLTKKEGHTDQLEGFGEAIDNLSDMVVEFGKYALGKDNVIDDINLKAAWTTGAMGFEENPQAGLSGIIDNVVSAITGLPTAARDEYFRSELGTNEPIKADLTTEEAYRLVYNAVSEKMNMVNPNTGKQYTMSEIEDELVLPFATAQYGISGAKSDLVGQELLDPTNYAGNIQNSVVNTYAKVTGNQPLQTATEINAGESIAPFPLNALSSKQKTGGLTELAEIHKKVLRGELGENAVKVDTLTEAQRNTAGLTPEGKYRELQPAQPTQATGLIGKITNAVQNLTNLTPVAKAAELSKMALDMTSAVILMSDGNPENIRTNVLKLADMMEVSPDDTVSKIYGTAEQRTVTDALKAIATSPKFDGIVNQLKATESMRMNLSLLSTQIGKSPTEIIQGIIDNPQSIKRLIQDAAAKNNGSIMGQMLTDDGTLIIDQFQVFTDKKNPLPYTVEQVASEYNKLFADTLSDYVTELYDVKPDNVAIRISDMMKKFQNLLLLSLNPAYLANNFTNDIVTRAAEGVFGFPNINDWVENEMGIAPARMYDSMQEFRGAENNVRGAYSIVNEKIKNAKRKGDKVDKISDLFSKVNSVMPGTKINGKIEGVESARANVVGQMQYMHKFWEAGKGFDELPPELKQRIDSVIPNGSWLLYSGIQSGYNFDKIMKNLFGEYVKPDLGSLLESIVQDKFPIDSEIVNELFAKTGKLSELQTLLDNTNTPEERAAVIESIRNRSKDIVKMYSDNQIISEAENVRNDIALIGDKNQMMAKAMEWLSYVSISREDQWLRSRDTWRDAYFKRRSENEESGEWSSHRILMKSVAARSRNQWNAFNARETQIYTGIVRALGFSDEITSEYLNHITEYQNNWKEFYKFQQQKINEYFDKLITWDDYLDDTNEAYERHFQSEMLIQETMNQTFLRGYFERYGSDITPIETLQNRIIEIRHDMHNMQVDIRQRLREISKGFANTDEDKILFDRIKSEMYMEFEPEYNGKIAEIEQLQSQLGAELARDPVERAREQFGNPIKRPEVIDVTPADNLDNAVQKMKAQVILTDADVIRSNAQTDYDNAIHETEADRQAKAERPEYYTRDKIRQAFIDSGIPEDAVDLYMELFDAREKQWNKDNPGKDMYKEALRVINISKDEMQGDPLLSQVEVLSPADINTDKFRNWFGDSKVVDADGKPLVVYHGSPYNFEVFSYDKMGTNGTSEGYGFYFSDSKDIAEGYSRGQGNKYESYVKITKPLSNDGKSLTKNDLRKLIINIDKMDIEGVESEHWFLSNFNDVNRYGINKVVNEAVNLLYENNSNDVDLISEMINVSGSAEKVYRALKNTLGYDGIITKWEANDVRGDVNIYIPFLPEQIKSVYNTGTWDQNNPNMLYQLGEPILETDINTPAFRKAFANTKVADENGNPIPVYHRSKNQFEEFDYSKIKTHFNGYGFYFDTRESGSKAWGDIVYKSFVNLENPLIRDASDYNSKDYVNLTVSEVQNYLYALDDIDDNQILLSTLRNHIIENSKYEDVKYTIESLDVRTIAEYLVNNASKDTDIIDDIIDASGKDTKTALETLRDVTGYDGYIVKYGPDTWEVVAWFPEQIKSVYNTGTWDPNNPNMLYQTYSGAMDTASPFYSHMETVVADKFPEKMKVESVRNWLIKHGVSTEELRWSGVDDFLTDATGQVTKADLQSVIDSNNMKIEEVINNDDNPEYYILEREYEKVNRLYNSEREQIEQILFELGYSDTRGFDYYLLLYKRDPQSVPSAKREIIKEQIELLEKVNPVVIDNLITHGDEIDSINEKMDEIIRAKESSTIYDQYNTSGDYTNYTELIITLPNNKQSYKSVHWDDIQNPIFHVRFNDRIDTQGRRILYIEEFQSDWLQDIRKGKNVPDAPFKDTWESKAIQRMMNYAAQNGYDMVAWTPGLIQMERWSLGGVADNITYETVLGEHEPPFKYLTAKKDNKRVFSGSVKETELPDYIGKERANLILNSQKYKETGKYTLSGEEMTVGDRWPLKVYDQDITNATKKIVKKYGSDLETITIDAGEKGMLDVSAYKVTPDMKEPQRLFQNTLNERIKGTFHVVDGDTAIRLLESKDISTMVHESGHLFRRTLNDKQMGDFAQWAGFKSADEYLDYDNRFWDGKLTEEESKRYSEAEEKFARGWEQYLIEGKAPTPTLTKVFKAFTEWMLDIYKAVKSALTSKDYSGQKEFIFNGKPLDIKAEINGVRLVDIFDSMLATKETRGATTTANSIIDPTTRYEFQYKIMELSDIKPSHQWSGDKLIDNSMYDKALQPRAREQQQSVMQINNMASELSPDLLLLESHSLDRGAPIIGDDNNIESGNGRMLALLRAKERYPERWAEYQQALLSEINNYGINPEALSEFRNPVLVRERITDIDRTDFAREANKPVALQMTAQENAVNDSKLISDVALSNLDILDNETIEGAIDARRNAGFVQSFMGRLSENEAAQYYFKNKDGNLVLNEQGRRRIVNALFAKVYGQSGDSLLQSFTMSTESNIKLLEAALKDSLPQMAVIEGMIARGSRSPEYSIANDITIAGEKLTRLRRNGMNVSDYLNQVSLPGLEEELTPAQRMFLQYFSEQRSAKKMRQFIREYANLIRNMPDSGQDALFNLPPVSKEELITRAFEKIGDDKSPMLFQTDWLASAIAQFDAGNPITLEQLKQIATPDYQNTELTPDANIIPDIDEYTTDEIYAKKINPIMHGEYMIAARVYKDGFPIAYYPYNLRMKEIPYNGKVYDVLGIDIDNADKYLFWDGEQIITIDTKQDLADLDIMDDMPTIPQGKQESFLTMPAGEAYEELVSKYLDPILDELHDRYEAELTRNKIAGSFSQLDNDSKVALYKYMNGVKDSLAATKYNALKFGEMKRDQALLNYNKRYGFDTYLTVISPYQFWYTRSMLNWAKRMIDKPVWFTTYARLKEKEELFARDENPTRLSGKNKFPMPYLEDWMGGALYIDTMSQFFPFAQFLNKAESYSQDKNFLNKKVESLLKEQLDEGMIKSQDYLEALRTKNTPAWNDAYAIISENYSKDPSLGGLAQQYMSLPFLLTWAINKAKGKEGEIGNLPITRTGLSLQTLTKGIPVLETAGNIVGGAMTLPEQGLRKLFNLDYNELGNYGDYSIRKQLSQMGNSGEISREEMLDAQRTFSGPAYEEAYRRQREELMLKTQGAAAIDAMKAFIQGDAKITDVLQALFVAPFGGSVYPEDEYQLRQKQDELEQAYDDQASGKRPNAVSEFFDANPTFIGRKASFIDDPEELNKYIAYQNITNAYYNLPIAQQQAVRQSLGTDFYNAVINKETRNYKATSYDDLLTWEYAMRGDIPNLPASEINKAKANAPKMTYYTQPVVDEVETFKRLTKQNFPANIEEMNRYYYTLPKDERYAYLNLHPEVGEFQQFKRNYRNANQGYDTYLEDYSAFQNEIMAVRCFAEMAESVRNDLEYSKVTGKELRGASINQLKYLYQKYDNFNTFDEFVEILKVYE